MTIKSLRIKFTILILLSGFAGFSSQAQEFGQNKVQYNLYNWNFIQTPHFDIYFSEGGLELAEFTAREAETAYRFITDDFRWSLPQEDRISIIVYNSHNTFEQTNVVEESITEGTQGFTEFFKNRVVVQYQGSWTEFRHLIHHELTHGVANFMLFGSGMMSILQGFSRTRIPLWFIEGLAEYESNFGIDTESDMYIRDMVVNSRLPDLEYLDYYGYYGVYKGGQSFFQFIAETYGKEKIGELMHKIRSSKDTGRAFKNSLGLEWKELNRRWQQFVSKQHWMVGAQTEHPIDFAEKITDHKEEENNFYDISPAISPRGDQLVYISNSSDYFDVYLYSLVENKRLRKLISGERTKSFEELHILRPGITWSPDSKRIALAAKAGERDAISIVDIETGKVQRTISFDLDGIFSPAWHPNGDQIAFTGMKNGVSDIYIVNLNNGQLQKVTDDLFSDFSPNWSPGGDRLVFASDRKAFTDTTQIPYDFDIADHNFNDFDLYLADKDSGWKLARVIDLPSQERDPIFATDEDLIFSSDANGVFNLFRLNLTANELYPITNVVTGCFQPSTSNDARELAFSALFNFGFDIYLLSNPLSPTLKKELKPTPLREKLDEQGPLQVPQPYSKSYTHAFEGVGARPYRNYVFDYRRSKFATTEKVETVDTTNFRTEAGEFVVNPYKIRFTTDYVYASAYFSSVWGARGIALAHFSDILGDHNLYFMTDLQNQIEISNFLFGYQYLRHRLDLYLSLYHFIYYFSTNQGIISNGFFYDRTYIRDRNYGTAATLAYPLSKFTRLELNGELLSLDRAEWDPFYEDYFETSRRRLFLSEMAYVKDTAVERYFGPMNGGRIRLSLIVSPNLYPSRGPQSSTQGLDFQTLMADYRHYFKAGFDYSFAIRFAAGASFGNNPQQFFLGGVTNWINRPYYIDVDLSDIEDIYIARFITPFRGGSYYERIGDKFFLNNLEFRFPFIQYLIFGWPVPYPFVNVRGALFSDFGSAWSGEFTWFEKDEQGHSRFSSPIWGMGFGIRFPLPFIGWPTRWDVAWKTDLYAFTKPRYYLSLGYEF